LQGDPEVAVQFIAVLLQGARNHVIDKLSFRTDDRWCTDYSW